MKKHLKILNLLVILTLMFSIFSFVGCESFAFASQNTTVQSTNVKNSGNYDSKNVQQSGFKYNLYKFFTALFGVLISSMAIYLGLKAYKKFVLKNNQKLDSMDYGKNLESPKDFKEAINLFLDKTDKF